MSSSGGESVTLAQLNVILEAQSAGFRSEMDKVKKIVKDSTGNMNGNLSKVDKTVKSVIGKIPKLLSFAAASVALKKVGSAAIDMASDLTEVQNVVDTAFGEMSYLVENFSKKAIDQFGMSELTAKRTASTYMAMSKGMGLADEKAAKMSIAVAGLTGDVASFYNVSQEVADTALKSIWTGETESLKKFGIVMTQTNLQQFAYSKGIQDNIANMDQAQLTTLRYMYVMDQLSLAQGDFAKTSGNWANQLRILSERWKQLLGIIGNGLIQVLTPVVRLLNLVMSKLVLFANVLSGVFGRLFGKKEDPMAGVADSTSDATKAQKAYTDSLKKSDAQAKKNKRTLAGFDEINNIQSSSGSGAEAGGAGQGYDIDFGMSGINFDELEQGMDTTGIESKIDKVMDKFNNFKEFLGNNKGKILATVAGIGTGIGGLLLSGFGTNAFSWGKFFNAKAIGTGLKTALTTGIKGINASFLATPFGSLMNGTKIILNGKLIGLGNSIKSMILKPFASLGLSATIQFEALKQGILGSFSGILGPLQGFANSIMGIIGPIISSPAFIIAAIAAVVAGLVYLYTTSEEFRDKVNGYISDIIAKAQEAWQWIKDICTQLWEQIISPIVDLVVEKIEWLWNNGFKKMLERLTDFVAQVIGFVLMIWNNTLAPFISWIIDFLSPMVLGVVDMILSYITAFLGGFIGIIDSILEVLSGVITFLTGVFTGDWELAWEGVKDIFRGIVNGIISLFEGMINFVIAGINGLFDAINWLPSKLTKIPGLEWMGNLQLTHIAEVKLPRLQKMAQGGLAYGETPVIVGDYANASTDPEVISPLSKLQNLMGFSNVEILNALMILIDLVTDIKNKKDTNSIDIDSIANRVKKINDDRNRRGGTPSLAVGR